MDARARLEIVDGLLKALDDTDLMDAIDQSETFADARKAMWRAGYSDAQVGHVLDMPLRQRLGESRRQLIREAAELRQGLAEG